MNFLSVLKGFLKVTDEDTFNKLLFTFETEQQIETLQRINDVVVELTVKKVFPRTGLSICTLISRGVMGDDIGSRRKFTKALYTIFDKQQQYTQNDVLGKIKDIIKVYFEIQD